MRMVSARAAEGLNWAISGVNVFRAQPFAWISLILFYLFVVLLFSMIPILGPIALSVLTPGLSVGFLAAARASVSGERFTPTVLLEGFKQSGRNKSLLILGCIHAVAVTAILVVLSLFISTPTETQGTPDTGEILQQLIPALLLYLPVGAAFWYSPTLVAWNDIPPPKAIFFSAVACWRNRGAFTVYGLLVFAGVGALSMLVGSLVKVLALDGPWALGILQIFAILALCPVYASFYETYRGVFKSTEET